MKKSNKVHIAVVILSAVFLLAGCGDEPEQAQTVPYTELEEDTLQGAADNQEQMAGSQEQETGKTPENQPASDETPAKPEAGTAGIYEAVLEEYRDMVRNDFYEELLDKGDMEAYDSSFGGHISFEARARAQDLYYALYDIDGNGVEELVIAGGEGGTGSASFAPWNYDLYTYDGTNVVPVFPDMEFGYRTNFSLYGNGVIEVFYSSSAAESGVDFYKIGADGISPERVDSFVTVGSLDGEEVTLSYFQNGTEITEDEYSAKIQSYEAVKPEGLEWEQIQ